MHKKLWNRDFFLILQGSAVSALGDILYSVAIGYWVYEKTGSSALMGVMSSISMFMTMLVMPFSGAIIDKCDRKAVIVGMDGLRGILMLGVGALAFADRLHVAAVLGAAFLASACSVFFEPAVSTLMIDIIPHDDMVRGQSVQEGVSTAVGLVGKALSGALTAFFGVPVIIFLNGISYLFSAFTELFIRVPQTKHQGEKVTVKGVLGDFTAAVRTILRDRFLRLFGPCTLAINLLAAGPMMLMLPFTMEKGFTVEQYGYLMSAQTAASLICVCLLGVVKLPPRLRYYAMGIGFLGYLLCSTGAYLATDYAAICILLFLAYFACTLGNSIFNAALMLALPEENRGGILGFVGAASMGGGALSSVVYGVLCDIFPLPLVFLGGNLLALIPMLHLCLHKNTKEFILQH